MENNRITFDQLPIIVQDLSNKIDNIEILLKSLLINIDNSEENKWFTIEGVANYLPNKPAISTLRDKARRREIPCIKQGRRWLFNKATIDKWLQDNSRKSATHIEVEAEKCVNNRYTNKDSKYFRVNRRC